ncbi:flavodoxin [Loigolactobacillus binensis]|uniref:Flavodoxin n=1 Tax=Loigolactobacillus binensis TaxID=2559922 RepID=A0ABW3EEQ6_9LACO|nr:flavodoxin [Loigolactobacillus binensis]
MNNEKILIIYFSLSGNTARVAKKLQKQLHADIYRLQPTTPYPDDYEGLVAVGEREKDQAIHPQIAGQLPDLAQYTEVYIGYPIWWSRPPMIIHSLFDQYDLTGKKIIPFATSASTPLADTLAEMSALAKSARATLITK